MDFSDKRVLITGAAGGFGRLLATRLVNTGARLVLGDLKARDLEEFSASLSGDVAFPGL